MVHMPGEVKGRAWKFSRPFHGPYRVIAVTPTNVEVKLVSRPDDQSIFVSLSRVRPCYAEMSASGSVWTGHGAKKSKRTRAKKSDLKRSPPSSDEYKGPITRSRSKELPASSFS